MHRREADAVEERPFSGETQMTLRHMLILLVDIVDRNYSIHHVNL
jgi:hypothetical protein